MNKNYEPDNDKNLMPIKLVELVNLDNIIYKTHNWEKEEYKKIFSEMGKNITFYVDINTNLCVPLKMQLYGNRRDVLIPNQPIGAIKYEETDININSVQFNNLGMEFPSGLGFNNIRRAPGNNELYFEDHESGWIIDEQGKPLEARIDFKFNDKAYPIKMIYVIKYKI